MQPPSRISDAEIRKYLEDRVTSPEQIEFILNDYSTYLEEIRKIIYRNKYKQYEEEHRRMVKCDPVFRPWWCPKIVWFILYDLFGAVFRR